MAVIDSKVILDEVVVKLRNADVLSIAERGVSTVTLTEGVVNVASLVINVPDVKNVRSVKVDAASLVFGRDYLVDYISGGNTEILFDDLTTGIVEVIYDRGTDKIWPGYPRQDISINALPQIGVEFIDIVSDSGGFGNVNVNDYDISIVVYNKSKEDVRNTVNLIRTFIVQNMSGFYYLKLVKPRMVGPLVVADFEKFKNQAFKQNLDFNSRLNIEVNN